MAAGHVHVGSGKGALHARRGHRHAEVALRRRAARSSARRRSRRAGSTSARPTICLYTLKADDGRLRWKLATGGEITGSPVVKDGVVYACSKDRCVYALDAEKGTGTARTG